MWWKCSQITHKHEQSSLINMKRVYEWTREENVPTCLVWNLWILIILKVFKLRWGNVVCWGIKICVPVCVCLGVFLLSLPVFLPYLGVFLWPGGGKESSKFRHLRQVRWRRSVHQLSGMKCMSSLNWFQCVEVWLSWNRKYRESEEKFHVVHVPFDTETCENWCVKQTFPFTCSPHVPQKL